jgi:hypothetical protein
MPEPDIETRRRGWCRTTVVSRQALLPVFLGIAAAAILGALYLGAQLPVTAPASVPVKQEVTKLPTQLPNK